ncbi:MAG TPA: peptidoglycan-binding domain-containing protein [Solirubrobacteraceae bacterium]|nr:peptidoglycan-binding domain-containing protein [Solirubrobacteraceae bacterium]
MRDRLACRPARAGVRRSRQWWTLCAALAAALLLAVPGGAAARNPLASRGMWIWYVSQTDGGSVPTIAADARSLGIGTLLIKSGDGSSAWSQFSRPLVSRLHGAGLHVCAWQYVYGNNPAAEARVGAAAVRNGADCLMIDAEGEYEGKYVQAQTYIHTLRGLIGSRFPLALAGLPYMDYHPAFPYSVFLGPGAAQYNAPQMYWTAIGTSVDRVYAHTYEFNKIYLRTMFPLGDITSGAPTSEIMRFRQLSKAYGAPSISWWDWQESSASALRAISSPLVPTATRATVPPRASLGSGAKGDIVVWAQEHLDRAGAHMTVDGAFGPGTRTAVINFQAAHGLSPTGLIDEATWHRLLRYAPVAVHWSRDRAVASVARSGSSLTLPVPRSAHLHDRGEELRGRFGRG